MKSTSLQLATLGAAMWLGATPPQAAPLVTILKTTNAWLLTAADKVAAKQSYKLRELTIEAPWVRATPGGAQVASGYLKITNAGNESDFLIGGSLPVAKAGEVHEMTMTDGVMKMRMLEKGLEIKGGTTVELKPGGYHLMFTGLREGLKQGQTIKGMLTFQKAGSIEVEYRVAPVGAQSSDHMHH